MDATRDEHVPRGANAVDYGWRAGSSALPRAARAIFEALADEEKYESFEVKAAYLEIYNEELSDLLEGCATDSPAAARVSSCE